ncbi:hypothetical protein Patl1_04509 [Pistacia atlantica]|uniref:Uncharacterized protein n=1 Tax=Pistacia atlantica TaxID=434234 RepID=A0ACC1BUW7_9ROSI|nr:hypothetical protein Patl1_04509 [Pistacia atlantica]
MIVIPILSMTMVILGFIIHYVRRKHRRKGEDLLLFDMHSGQKSDDLELTEVKKLGKNSRKEVKLPLFSFASVSAATDQFLSHK